MNRQLIEIMMSCQPMLNIHQRIFDTNYISDRLLQSVFFSLCILYYVKSRVVIYIVHTDRSLQLAS